MSQRYQAALVVAASQDGVLPSKDLDALGVPASTRTYWTTHGRLRRVGPHSFVAPGSPASWQQRVRAASEDLDGRGAVAGRSAARLLGLDGFGDVNTVELLVPRAHRRIATPHVVRSTSFPFEHGDLVIVGGMRCLSTERLIVDTPLFRFSRHEVERVIDSAIRLRRVHEPRLRARVERRTGHHLHNHRMLVSALVDTGGESHLERRFLGLLRASGLPRPELQRVFRSGSRTIARVDAVFPNGLVVELAGHATHSSRRQRQHDEQRRTELVLAGQRVITFTYDDVDERPNWVASTLAQALAAPTSRESRN